MSKAILEGATHLSAGPHSGACLKGGKLWWFYVMDVEINLWSRSVDLPAGLAADDIAAIAASAYGATVMAVNADLWSWDARSGRWTRLGNVAEPPAHAR